MRVGRKTFLLYASLLPFFVLGFYTVKKGIDEYVLAYRPRPELFPRQEFINRHGFPADSQEVRIPYQYQGEQSFIAGSLHLSEGRPLVILLHGTGANRQQLVHEAIALADSGLGFFLMDWPGHGESPGSISWDDRERKALSEVVHWLREGMPSPKVAPLAIYAFSMGAWIAASSLEHLDGVDSLVLAGVPADAEYGLNRTGGVLGYWGSFPARLVSWLWGSRYWEKAPMDEIGRRPHPRLLIVSGKQDEMIPTSESLRVFQKASEPRALWIAESAGHGDYLRADPQGFYEHVIGHFMQVDQKR